MSLISCSTYNMSAEREEANVCLATSGDDIKLWGSKGFVLNQQYNPHSGAVSSLCWSHDNSVSLSFVVSCCHVTTVHEGYG
jgi:WD40 repeat protein